jgi:signal transduction histidine kinase
MQVDREPPFKQEAAQAEMVLPGVSLARKGMWTLAGLLVYFLAVTVVITYERHSLMSAVRDLESVHRQEERQVSLNLTVAHAILTVNENYFSPDIDAAAQMLVLDIEAVLAGVRKAAELYPMLADDQAGLEQVNRQLLQQPSRSAIAETRSAFHRLVIDLDTVTSDIRARKQRLLDDYRSTYNRVSVEWLLFMVAGVGAFGGLGLVFFRRLAKDIDTVRSRAIEIVRGYRGEPLAIDRGDEMGALMAAVNGMQLELRQRETQLELSRQQHFHKEKMAAVGSLAAAVAHEINNPLSAIVGIAEVIASQSGERHCTRDGAACQPQMILDQARRVMQITRQISEFSVPQSPEPELIDLNGLARSTCGFVSFDRRFRRVELVQSLDPQLPAVLAVADHLVQVLMNLLINAADAIGEEPREAPRIEVRTRLEAGWVKLEVVDNGAGIAPEHIDLVFTEHFTTKPPGHGSGLGLALCRSLIQGAGGEISITSRQGEGTVVAIVLPVPARGPFKD